MISKICKKCKKRKRISKFDKQAKGKNGLNSQCKTCRNDINVLRTYNSRSSRNQKNCQLKIKYSITVDDYEILLKNQNFKCIICEKHMSEFKKNFAVDHDHSTGAIRGLLCQFCNTGLGLFREDKSLLINAVNYLERFN